MPRSVNARADRGAGPERTLLGKVVGILQSVGWLSDVRVQGGGRAKPNGADAIVHLGVAKGRHVRLRVYAKKELRPSGFSAWASSRHGTAKEEGVPVLAMPFVSPRLADLCKQAGWSWCDLAGNCLIDVPGLLHVQREGNAPVHRRPRPGANLGTAAAGRVLRALLTPAHAGRTWTQRSLQASTSLGVTNIDGEEVSLGLVNKVIRHLRDEGFVQDAASGGMRVRDPSGLLAAWSEAYRFDRHERRAYFSLLKGTQIHEALSRVEVEAGAMVAYAALSAAERQAPHVRQPKTWIYIGRPFLESLIHQTQAKEVDSGETMVVLVPADMGVFLSFDSDSKRGSRTLGCTDPVQTYVDLVHCGGRGEEAAQALLEQKIRPAWKTVGTAW